MYNNYKITYEKNINDSFMFITGIKIDKDNYESILIKNENIDRIIKYYLIDDNGTSKLRYDITNLLSLESYLSKKPLNCTEITFIINEISNMLSTIENYLISENSIILDPKTIMIALTQDENKKVIKKLFFTAIPGYNGNFYNQIVELLLFILRNIDKNDKNAIMLSHNLFIESAKDNFTFSNLLNILEQTQLAIANYSPYKNFINNDKTINSSSNDKMELVKEPHVLYEQRDINDINYNGISIDEYTKNAIDNKYLSDYIDEEQNRKNIEYLKSLDLDNINEGYDIDTVKTYRDRIIANSAYNLDKENIFKNLLSIKSTALIVFGFALPVVIKAAFGSDALFNNLKYLAVIEIILIAFVGLDIFDSLKAQKAAIAQ